MGRREFLFLVPLFALGGAGCSVALGIDGEYEDCTCGDGVVCSIEACDDGNTSDSDHCSSTCVLREVVEVTAGDKHTCARLNDGSVKCWGSNSSGQLGLVDKTVIRGDNPGEMGSNFDVVNLGEGRTAVRIAAGGEHTCAILDNGNVRCWGNNTYWQLGFKPSDEPVDLSFKMRAVAIGAGFSHTCAILNDGSLECWGRNDDGQLGAGDTPLSELARPVDLGKENTAVAIALGAAHTCALLNAGAVKCWGKNEEGQLGLGDTSQHLTPAGPVNLGTRKAITLAAGYNHTCAALSDDSLLCWGRNDWGGLGLGHMEYRPYPDGPVNLENGMAAAAITAGEAHSCAILSVGSVQCWGYNNNGQLGVGDAKNYSVPRSVNLGEYKKAVSIASGQYHTCVILSEGSLKCWGSNGSGQLGLGDTLNRGQVGSEMGENLLAVKLF